MAKNTHTSTNQYIFQKNVWNDTSETESRFIALQVLKPESQILHLKQIIS